MFSKGLFEELAL